MIPNNLGSSKYICLHGLKITDILSFNFKINDKEINVTFVPYDEFVRLNIISELINRHDIVTCDIVIIIDNMRNNTVEIQLIKTAVSILYFANRMKVSTSMQHSFKIDYPKRVYNDFFENHHLNGFITPNNYFGHLLWIVNLGKSPVNNDNFESLLTRGYGNDFDTIFDNRDSIERLMHNTQSTIEVDDCLKVLINKIQNKIDKNDTYSRKLLSSFRLYFDMLCEFRNPDQSIISACTILETLLLKDDEDNQRKKASARASCIIANGLSLRHKKFIANIVYFFYKYRNEIVHDGKGIMDFEEFLYTSIMHKIKHIIFSIIQYIVVQNIESTDQIKELVENNLNVDQLNSSFEYIDFDKIDNNEPVEILIFE